MLKKTIKYEDYNGEMREETFLFSLNKAELLRMDMTKRGGMEQYLKKIVDERDPEKLTQMFEDWILLSYGVKSDDGTRFIKSPEVVSAFKDSAAYAELFCELVTDMDKFLEFILGVVPAEMSAEMRKNGAIDKAKKEALSITGQPLEVTDK